jgi:hypothetical protein
VSRNAKVAMPLKLAGGAVVFSDTI